MLLFFVFDIILFLINVYVVKVFKIFDINKIEIIFFVFNVWCKNKLVLMKFLIKIVNDLILVKCSWFNVFVIIVCI